MKVFILQPMINYSGEELKKRRNDEIEFIKSCFDDVEIIDSINEDNGSPPIKCLAWSIDKLADADIIWLMEGWEKARDCKFEYEIAKSYGVDVIRNEVDGNIMNIKNVVEC